mmetsp:Transcript_17965/g.32805  ORF Transcript_17965/g.32805 Transcript_17965/m.32805 type:complete len:254 (-) Transcript_17965:323-1084(-)
MSVDLYIYYIPIPSLVCVSISIIGVAIWTHFTILSYHGMLAAATRLGATVDILKSPMILKSVQATTSVYMIFCVLLFVLAYYKKYMIISAGAQPSSHVIIQRTCQALWWMFMVWVVVLLTGQSSMLTYASVMRGVISKALDWQTNSKPSGEYLNPLICPGNCLNLGLYNFLSVDSRYSCICDNDLLTSVSNDLHIIPKSTAGIMVGLWLMYIMGDVLKNMAIFEFFSGIQQQQSAPALPPYQSVASMKRRGGP